MPSGFNDELNIRTTEQITSLALWPQNPSKSHFPFQQKDFLSSVVVYQPHMIFTISWQALKFSPSALWVSSVAVPVTQNERDSDWDHPGIFGIHLQLPGYNVNSSIFNHFPCSTSTIEKMYQKQFKIINDVNLFHYIGAIFRAGYSIFPSFTNQLHLKN